MLKCVSVFLIVVTTVISCSEDASPSREFCESSLTTGAQFKETYGYTGAPFTITGTSFCTRGLEAVLLNETEVAFKEKQDTKLSFVIPEGITTDSVAVKVRTKNGIVDLHKKIAIFPGSGEWSAVQAFPGGPRLFSQAAAVNGKGYVSAGEHFDGYTNGVYNATRYDDLYEFDPSANSWTLIAKNDKFTKKIMSVGWGNKLVLFPYGFNSATTFEVGTGIFDQTGSSPSFWQADMTGFTIGSDLCCAISEMGTKSIKILKYNTAGKTWDIVQSTSFNEDYALLSFAFEYDGIAYLGWWKSHSSITELWMYDPGANTLSKVNSIKVTTTASFPFLRHLFTLKGQAYFIEIGESSIGPDGVKVINPAPRLYILNIKAQTWRVITHLYPAPFYGSVSFGVGNRGFSGFNGAAGIPTFIYSTNFYEFKPK